MLIIKSEDDFIKFICHIITILNVVLKLKFAHLSVAVCVQLEAGEQLQAHVMMERRARMRKRRVRSR